MTIEERQNTKNIKSLDLTRKVKFDVGKKYCVNKFLSFYGNKEKN